ncbi:RelA/SpoT family protein [Alicyclobacillus fastidiosus]|uniref:GTP pyrophosphokinase n=1 Tax=Alicyclobacillus fastidiosus TaxID=392011 RepID=A0ABV5ACZ0_9BACL|nr:bifunctional (p)ppGpp synthetase/guanosine-3',5'-bis(diphosphate) 3'-pyrophosphohydrolase [Alicyclobacillus fastidiosus]WEH11216.1 bifunctional (p)ppGpp synthetase/guanosine-3',5'-bis(diphosphate) 3'-pyrophosphohydrolase [Alicyclobacillus fastidiosus]
MSEQTIDALCEQLKTYCSADEVANVRAAYLFAERAHAGQQRMSGEPYITHPLAVAFILAGLQLDATAVIAALLHDVVEDTEVTDANLVQNFGAEVAALVDGVTKLKRIKFDSREEQQAENLRKMFMAMAKDIRVLIIKLADRLHNMRTIRYQTPETQRRKARETLEIFAPLAHRLGINTIKWELEDISLRYLNPQQYYRIVNLMARKRQEREQFIDGVMDLLREKLTELHLKAEVSGRAKHIYSIYRKMTTQHKEFNEIYDLFAIRVTVENIKDCYGVLGVIHTMWKPMPGRFKDYIAMPKANMYQSLHTTVIGPNGEPLEIQIRTWEMHQTAEYGIAAHWVYKEGNSSQRAEGDFAKKLAWFREVLEWQQDFRDAQEFMETLKIDLFSDQVFVFTPKGDVIELPAGSVPIDFAYRIHTAIGNRCIGAKVNGKMVPLDYRLRTGDIVEVATSKHSYGPSRDWLKIVQSSQAKSKIRQWFKREKREENIARGRELIEKELLRQRLDPKQLMAAPFLNEALHKFSFGKEEDLFAAVGYGGMSAAQVVTRLVEAHRKSQDEKPVDSLSLTSKTQQKPTETGVRVKGVDNLLIRFARCCHPVPGDEIVGFVTRGRGVSVHRMDCPNVASLTADGTRALEVEWATSKDWSYNAEIEVTALDRHGLVNEVLNAIAETKTEITAVSARADAKKIAHIHMSVRIRNLDHLRSVVERLKRLKDIYSVRRMVQ